LSAAGNVVAEEWLRTAQLRPNVRLDRWQLMPNHFHGIIAIFEKNPFLPSSVDVPVKTLPVLEPDSLGSIIGQVKSQCTKRIRREVCRGFAWQERFWDHAIEDEDELNEIRDYIGNNPRRWDLKTRRR
jgi:REP element-mobilizing transposase RayT